ncbi:MAG: GGDEF domain-containing protein [Deltaproteobacteria bacterium]|nr:MAG: GGDEF domain-containing protein [Deltaproteobacteria bacterium]
MNQGDGHNGPLYEEKTRKAHVAELQQAAPSKKSFLIQIYGPSLGRNFPVDRDLITIGRDPANTIQVDQENVSRQHAKLERISPSVFIEDLGSTNGTYLNDLAIKRERLRHGDLIKIGGVVFKFVSGGNIEGLYHEEIYRMTITDGLTQVANKRYLYEFLEREIARTIRFGRPLSLIMLDIDHFKQINDTFGHLAGDYVLKEMCKELLKQVRREELLARYGGEEFVVVLPETALSTAATMAEKLRRVVANHHFSFAGKDISITISLGCAELSPMATDPNVFLHEADARLYEAKRAGRNRVVA